jgi:IS605 OrfB family transposase
VDVNAGHLACWVIAPDGNPVGAARTISLELTGSTERRDGVLRSAVSELLRFARENGCASVTVENLDFADARAVGRETMGRSRRGKRFRRTVAGIPTGRFRDRLAGMAANAGISVVAVDPAYTSRWAGQHWHKPLDVFRRGSTAGVSRHHAAAVVIARRGLGHSARRRTAKTGPHQRMGAGVLRSRPDEEPVSVRDPGSCDDGPHQHPLENTEPPDQTEPGDQATQHRSVSPTAQDSLLLSD